MLSQNYSYTCKYVRKFTTGTGKHITAFSLGDKVKTLATQDKAEFINWSVTVWSDLNLTDGMKIRIDKIVNVSCEYYAGKNGIVKQYKMTIEGTPVTGNDDEFTPPQDEPVRRSNTVTDTGKQAEPFFPSLPGEDSDGFVLPFDV